MRAGLHHGDPIGQAEGLLLVMGDEDEGAAERAVDAAQLRLHRLAQLEIEGAQRLVQEQQPPGS